MFLLYWLIKRALGKLQPFEERIVADHFGLTHPKMGRVWARIRNLPHNPSDITHALTDVLVEWAYLHPQRAVKIGIYDQFFFWCVFTVVKGAV